VSAVAARVNSTDRVKVFPLPDLGEGLTEGEILKWYVAEGDTIGLNQPIVEVETAKAAVEIPAKWGGKVHKIFHPEGTTVEVGSPLIAIDTAPDSGDLPPDVPGGGDLPTPSAASLAAVQVAPAEGAVEPGMVGGPVDGGRTPVLVGYGPKTTAAKRRARTGTPTEPAASAAGTQPATVAADESPAAVAAPVNAGAAAPVAVNGGAAGVLAKPPVRKLARDLGVDLTALVGSGPQGSITREDVQAAVSAPAAPAGTTVAAPTPTLAFDASREYRVPVKGVRKLTAVNMVASAFTAPHVSVFHTVDVTRSMKALARLKESPEWQGVRVSPLLLVAKAVLHAIEKYPMVNSTWAGEEIVVKGYVNLGIAAATERGLVVPNIKDAGRLSLRELADAMTSLVQTAKAGRSTPAEMSGGTFSITNVGVFGIDTGTPILPPGEAAILALGTIRPTPWVHHGKIKIRQVTTLGLSFDHRIIDGELGSRFAAEIGDWLHDPQTHLLRRS
jgi:pyruvate dehydrogenase E2 component (dihydrolipoamide acetyltransferase)